MALLRRLGLRPDRGFGRIHRRHAGDVYRYALAMLGDPGGAEDVTETAFRDAHRAYARGERPRAPKNWLIAIAHNVCRQRFRQSERRLQELTTSGEVATTLVHDDGPPTIRDVGRALAHLPFYQRSALVMRDVVGRSCAEIAEAVELSVSAVETLLFRARRTLNEQLVGAPTCREAEFGLSRQIDGRLSYAERGLLRAHLRGCSECARLARRQREQSAALKALGSTALPASLASSGSLSAGAAGGGSVAVSGGLAAKAAAVVAAGALVGALGYEAAKRLREVPAAERTAMGHGGFVVGEAPSARATVPAPRRVRKATPVPRASAPIRSDRWGADGVPLSPVAAGEATIRVPGERHGVLAAKATPGAVGTASSPRPRDAGATSPSGRGGRAGRRGGSVPAESDDAADGERSPEIPAPPPPPAAAPAASAGSASSKQEDDDRTNAPGERHEGNDDRDDDAGSDSGDDGGGDEGGGAGADGADDGGNGGDGGADGGGEAGDDRGRGGEGGGGGADGADDGGGGADGADDGGGGAEGGNERRGGGDGGDDRRGGADGGHHGGGRADGSDGAGDDHGHEGGRTK